MGGFYQVAHAINDKLGELYKLWVEQNDGVQAEFSNFDDDTIMKMILTVEALIYFNIKNNVVAICKKKLKTGYLKTLFHELFTCCVSVVERNKTYTFFALRLNKYFIV